MGSIAKAANYMVSPSPAYKVSKAALNMLTVQYALSYAEQGFTIFAISPGVFILNYPCTNHRIQFTDLDNNSCEPNWAAA